MSKDSKTHLVTQAVLDELITRGERFGYRIDKRLLDVKAGDPVEVWEGRGDSTILLEFSNHSGQYILEHRFWTDMPKVEQEEIEELEPLPEIFEISVPTWMFTTFSIVAMWEIGFTIIVLNTDQKFECKVVAKVHDNERIVANKFLSEHPLKPNYTVDELPRIRITSDYDERRYFAIAQVAKLDQDWRKKNE